MNGKSLLYLPEQYAPCALLLPTCLRATAHHLAQHESTRGVFRIPGSAKVVNALYDHYCHINKSSVHITGTVRSVNLPMHIQVSVHDVASTFKRLLSVIPGGILGSLAVFDAFVSIQSQLHAEAEHPRTKQSRVRARLIALAIGSIKSQFRREMICAVFGLLNMIGRAAENAPREDSKERPLPTSDLMGYNALGIVFGPLLVGDLLDSYSPNAAAPEADQAFFSLSPTKFWKDRLKPKATDRRIPEAPKLENFRIANSVAEMLITNWRDVVRQMKDLGTIRQKDLASVGSIPNGSVQQAGSLRHSASTSFILKKPLDWDQGRGRTEALRGEPSQRNNRSRSPEPSTPTSRVKVEKRGKNKQPDSATRRPKPIIPLSPPTEESSVVDDRSYQNVLQQLQQQKVFTDRKQSIENTCEEKHPLPAQVPELRLSFDSQPETLESQFLLIPPVPSPGHLSRASSRKGRVGTPLDSPRVSLDDVPPRTSSKRRARTQHSSDRTASKRPSEEEAPIRTPIRKDTPLERRNGIRRKGSKKERAKKTPRRSGSNKLSRDTPKSSDDSLIDIDGTHFRWANHSNLSFGCRATAMKMAGPIEQRAASSPGVRGAQKQSPGQVQDTIQQLSLMEELDFDLAAVVGDRDISLLDPEYVYGSEVGKAEHIERSDSHESIPRTSITRTPSPFYSPMRVPTSLSKQKTPAGNDTQEARVWG